MTDTVCCTLLSFPTPKRLPNIQYPVSISYMLGVLVVSKCSTKHHIVREYGCHMEILVCKCIYQLCTVVIV